MACIVMGLVFTLMARQLLIALKLNIYLRPVLLVYFCMMILFAMASWLAIYKN